MIRCKHCETSHHQDSSLNGEYQTCPLCILGLSQFKRSSWDLMKIDDRIPWTIWSPLFACLFSSLQPCWDRFVRDFVWAKQWQIIHDQQKWTIVSICRIKSLSLISVMFRKIFQNENQIKFQPRINEWMNVLFHWTFNEEWIWSQISFVHDLNRTSDQMQFC